MSNDCVAPEPLRGCAKRNEVLLGVLRRSGEATRPSRAPRFAQAAGRTNASAPTLTVVILIT